MKASVELMKRREFAFFLGSLALSWPALAETEGYKTIDWNDYFLLVVAVLWLVQAACGRVPYRI